MIETMLKKTFEKYRFYNKPDKYKKIIYEIEDYVRENYVDKNRYLINKVSKDRIENENIVMKKELSNLKTCFRMLKIKTDESWMEMAKNGE